MPNISFPFNQTQPATRPLFFSVCNSIKIFTPTSHFRDRSFPASESDIAITYEGEGGGFSRWEVENMKIDVLSLILLSPIYHSARVAHMWHASDAIWKCRSGRRLKRRCECNTATVNVSLDSAVSFKRQYFWVPFRSVY